MKIFLISILCISGLFAVNSKSQVIQQPPDTTLQFDPETGLPVELAQRLTGEELTPLQRLARRPFPIQYFVGRPFKDNPNRISLHLAISYNLPEAISFSLSKGFSFREYDADRPDYWRHKIILGFLQWHKENPGGFYNLGVIHEEYTIYGLVEAERRWEKEYLHVSVLVGAGLGRYNIERYENQPASWSFGDPVYPDSELEERLASYGKRGPGFGLMLSVGAQARVGRLTGDLRIFRTPGLGNVTVADLGYHANSALEGVIVTGVAAVTAVAAIVVFFLFIRID